MSTQVCPHIQRHLVDDRPAGVGKDDLLDAAAAAWIALWRRWGEGSAVRPPERYEKGLAGTIVY